jgi:hypothetical protein
MGTYEETPQGPHSLELIGDRQRSLARSVGDLLKWRNGRDGMDAWRAVTDDRMTGLEHKVDLLAASVDSLRKTIMGLAISIAGSAVIFALSVMIATGKIGG